ncbi:MAG: tetratricopeptide repeat protein, partial [Hyphomicrobiales bacterium]
HFMGVALHQSGDNENATKCIEKALELKPDDPAMLNNFGLALNALHHWRKALDCFNKSIKLNPEFIEARINRGHVLQNLGLHKEAIFDFSRVLIAKPDKIHLLGDKLFSRLNICDWDGIEIELSSMISDIAVSKPVCTPFHTLAVCADPTLQQAYARSYAEAHYPAKENTFASPETSPSKIKVAYFSSDFYDHATSYLMAGLFECHDRSKFEIHAISFSPKASGKITRRVKAGFTEFHDVSALSDTQIRELTRKLEIDIAVDLKGYTHGARPMLFAQRIAPVQISFLGYPGTLGISTMDYLIADKFIIPPGLRLLYDEKVIYLPGCYQPYDDKKKISKAAPSRTGQGLSDSAFVFCSFNNSYKFTPAMFDIWMRLLKKVDNSVLWLLTGNSQTEENLTKEAAKRGISDDRLIFADRVPVEDHIARHRLADLFLDTEICCAHTTASDALSTGLPIVTCTGQNFASRVAGSLLTALGMDELIANNLTEYEELVLKLARDPEKLEKVAKKLRKNVETSDLFKTDIFRRHLEQAYRTAWENHVKGNNPGYIDIAGEE